MIGKIDKLPVEELVGSHSQNGKDDLVHVLAQLSSRRIKDVLFDLSLHLILKVPTRHAQTLHDRLQILLVQLHRRAPLPLPQLIENLINQ